MAVLIEGMEMPYNCWDCSSLNASSCPCKNYSSALEYTTNRHPNCPLIEIPEPHGRLIDADTLLKDAELPAILYPYKRRDIEIHTHAVALGDVMNAPTVIPASKEAE